MSDTPVVQDSLTTDTPRTDANYICHYGDGIGQWVPREFACELERELAAAIAQRDKARVDALEEAAAICDSESTCEGIAQKCAAAIRAMKECGK
jgi:hypothetical protein